MSTSPSENPAQPSLRTRVLVLVALVALTVVAFAGVARCGWIAFDDTIYVYQNPYVSRGLTVDGLRWMMTHAHAGNFHPLTTISHMLDSQIFGLDPRGPHLVNLALHVTNVVLLCWVLARFTDAFWRSAAVAALFAIHPLRVESVAWVSERKDVLCTLFFLLALAAYRRWTESRTRGSWVLVCAWFTLGLLAKPMLVTFPFVLVLLDVWPLRRARSIQASALVPLLREKLALFGISALSSVGTFLVQRAAGAVQSADQLALSERVLNALASYARYVEKTFVPSDLAVYYPNPGNPGVLLPTAALIGGFLVTVFAWRARRERPWLLVGWLWFVGTLVPVIGIVQVGDQAFADRYTYIPSIGLAIAGVWIASELASRSALARRLVITAACALLVLCGIATARQVSLWKDTKTLLTHTLSITGPNAIIEDTLGCYLFDQGAIDEAIVHFENALRIAPAFPVANNDLGMALGKKRRFEEAILHFRMSLIVTDSADGHHNMGWALAQMGRREEAIGEYEKALRIDADRPVTQLRLGGELLDAGRFDEALVHLRYAASATPADPEVHRLLAIVHTLQGRIEEGVAEYRAVLRYKPVDLDALNNIAWIRATHADSAHRDGAEAVLLAEAARDAPHEPNSVLFSTLAAAYAEVGRFDDAVSAGERAVELARASGDNSASQRFETQLQRYRAREPFHQ